MAEPVEQQNRISKGLETFGNIFALNILFVVFSIPIFTIGASLTALYSMMLKMLRKEEGTIIKGFIQAFKSNFKKATLAWLIMIAAFVVLVGQYIYINNFEGELVSFYMVFIVIECVVVAMVFPFLFPLIARFENSLWNTFKNAFLLSISNIGSWLKITIAWFAPIYISLHYPIVILSTWYLWLLILFGVIAYGTSFTIRKVFNKVSETQEKAAEQEKKRIKDMNIRKNAMFGSENVSRDTSEEDTETADAVDMESNVEN